MLYLKKTWCENDLKTMWVSRILFRRHVPGRIFSGKHRVTVKVTKFQRKRENERDQHFENNKELLSYPYLTVAEEHSHAKGNKEERKKFFDAIKSKRTLGKPSGYNVTSSRTLGLLQHLNVTKT